MSPWRKVLLAPRLRDGFAKQDALAFAQVADFQHEALMSFSTLEICLGVGVILALLMILMLVRKMQQNSAKIQKLEDRARSLQHSLMLDHQKAAKDVNAVNAVKSTLAKEKQMLEARGTQISPKQLDSVTRAQMDEVLGRRKVTVDLSRQAFQCIQPIEFVGIVVTKDMVDPPAAEFADPEAAREILGDLALLLTFIKGAVVLVEGHTSGGQAAMSEIGFAIATERAELIVATLVELGIQKQRLEARGCPGWLGDNRHDTKIITLAWGF